MERFTAMKGTWCFSAMVLFSTVIGAQDYQISFAVLDDNEATVDSLLVQNIEQGHSITQRGNDILHLVASTTGISDLSISNRMVEVYPNPFSDKATIVFQNGKQGLVQLSLFDMTGKIVAQNSMVQSAGRAIFEVSGLPAGAYVIRIDTETSIFGEVIFANDASGTTPEISFKGLRGNNVAPVSILKSSNRTGELVEMQYNTGDTLFLTAYLGDLTSETKIVPVASTTISFEFRQDQEDISASATMTIDGGVLQVMDESGNIVKLTFPPGAVMDSTTVSLTLFFGDFAEGTMTLAQLNTQIDMLGSSLDNLGESGLKAAGVSSQPYCLTLTHKAIWYGCRSIAGSFMELYRQRDMRGYYNNLEEGENTFTEDLEFICTDVINVGIGLVLDLCIPDDLCDINYGATITSQLNIESGGIEINTIGAVPITMTASGNNMETIDSYGTLEVSGSGNAGGACTGAVDGVSSVNIYGTRDAAYSYELQVLLAQTAVLVVTCPDGSGDEVSLLNNAETRELTLNKAKGYSVTIEESGDGYSFTMDEEVINAYTSLPSQ